MSKLILSLIIVAISAGSSSRLCSCQKALEHDVPHGANVNVEYTDRTVKRIKGRVVYFNSDQPVEDVVVAIYKVTEADKNLGVIEIASRRKRQSACVTAKDGSFCFPDLPSGRYVLRAGVRSSHAGMSDVHMKVTVDRRWWSSWLRSGKEIKLELSPGS